MDLRNCKRCGKMFNYVTGPVVCPACNEKSEEDFQKVKQYIEEHPGTSVAVTAEECEVEVAQIRQWLKDERLTFTSAEGSDLTCEKCGTPILSGRFCDKCKAEVTRGFTDAIKKPDAPKPVKKDEPTGNKMRFLGGRQ